MRRTIKQEDVLLLPSQVKKIEYIDGEAEDVSSTSDFVNQAAVEEALNGFFMKRREPASPDNSTANSHLEISNRQSEVNCTALSLEDQLDSLLPVSGHVSLKNDFSFKDITKKTEEVRRTQRNIERILYADSHRDATSWGIKAWQRVNKYIVGHAGTLKGYFEQEQNQLLEVIQILVVLRDTCKIHGEDLGNFRTDRYKIIDGLLVARPPEEQEVKKLMEEYAQINQKLKRTYVKTPGYALLEDRRDNIVKAIRNKKDLLSLADETDGLLRESKARALQFEGFLQFGEQISRRLASRYALVYAELERVAPASVFIQQLFDQPDFVYNQIHTAKTAIQQATAMETVLKHPRLAKQLFSGYLTPPAVSVPALIDGVNNRYKKEGLDYLLDSKGVCGSEK